MAQYDFIKFKFIRFGIYNNLWFSVHNSYDIPISYDWDSVEVKKSFHYSITFSLTSFQLLRSPYSTDCKNYYKETEFLSRKDCIRKCKLTESQDKCGVVSHEVDVYENETNVRFAQSLEEVNCVKNLNLKSDCVNKCPNYDCFKQDYAPKITAQYSSNYNHCEVDLAIPTDPQLTHHHKPKIETIEFLCFMASTFSLWFGFNLLSIYDWIQIFCYKTKSSINKNKRINFAVHANHNNTINHTLSA